MGDGVRLCPIVLDVLHRTGFPAPCVVDEKLRIDTELLIERLLGKMGDAAHGVDALAVEPRRDALCDAPEVGERRMIPQRLLKERLVEVPDAVGRLFRRDVERDLGEIQIGADARRGGDVRAPRDLFDEELHELLGRLFVDGQIVGDIEEALVDGIDVDVALVHIVEVDAVDLGGIVDVLLHPRPGDDELEMLRHLEHPAAVSHP